MKALKGFDAELLLRMRCGLSVFLLVELAAPLLCTRRLTHPSLSSAAAQGESHEEEDGQRT